MSHELVVYRSVFNLFLIQRIMAILSKGCKSDNFEPHNSLKFSFTNIRGVRSNVEDESSLNQTLLTFLVFLGQAWMAQLILAVSL